MKKLIIFFLLTLISLVSSTNLIINDLTLKGNHELCSYDENKILIGCDTDLLSVCSTATTNYISVKSNSLDAMQSPEINFNYLYTIFGSMLFMGVFIVIPIILIAYIIGKLT